jgi:hypothetical protein
MKSFGVHIGLQRRVDSLGAGTRTPRHPIHGRIGDNPDPDRLWEQSWPTGALADTPSQESRMDR